MATPTGKEVLYSLRTRNAEGGLWLSAAHIALSILAAAAYWFGYMVHVVTSRELVLSPWHVLFMSFPSALVCGVWFFGLGGVVARLRALYTAHVKRVVKDGHVAHALMQPQLHEHIAKALGLTRSKNDTFKARVEAFIQRYPRLCRYLGIRPFPLPWAMLETPAGIMLLVATGLVIYLEVMFQVTREPNPLALAVFSSWVVLGSVKLCCYAARMHALGESVADALLEEFENV